MRFDSPAGPQAPVDIAEVRFPWGKRDALVVVLGYTPRLTQVLPAAGALAVTGGLDELFACFGGVPCDLLLDQTKAVVFDDNCADGRKFVQNPVCSVDSGTPPLPLASCAKQEHIEVVESSTV